MLRASALLLALPLALLVSACGGSPEPKEDPPARTAAPVDPVDLASPDVKTRIAAARGLRGGGEVAERAVPALATALADRNELVRQAATEALRDLGPQAAPALAALRRAFLDEDVYVRWHAAEALGRIGPGAAEALADLDARAADADEAEVVRAASVTAAGRIRGK